jgi:hypothetical protein
MREERDSKGGARKIAQAGAGVADVTNDVSEQGEEIPESA